MSAPEKTDLLMDFIAPFAKKIANGGLLSSQEIVRIDGVPGARKALRVLLNETPVKKHPIVRFVIAPSATARVG